LAETNVLDLNPEEGSGAVGSPGKPEPTTTLPVSVSCAHWVSATTTGAAAGASPSPEQAASTKLALSADKAMRLRVDRVDCGFSGEQEAVVCINGLFQKVQMGWMDIRRIFYIT
jgi:hypothetical protein